MAVLVNVNSGLTAAGARKVGGRSSYAEATYYLDGREPVPVSLRVEPDLNENPTRESAQIGNLLDHPAIAQDVQDHEKDALLLKKAQGAISSTIRDRRADDLARRELANSKLRAEGKPEIDPEGGAPQEWDHLVVSLDENETAWLNSHPEAEEAFREAVVDAFRFHPSASGTRQAIITGIHKDTGRWHIQGLVSRYSIDYSTQPPTVPAAVDMARGGEMQKIVRRLNDAFKSAGLPFATQRTNDPSVPTAEGEPVQRSVFEDRRISDDAKEEYADAVRAEGGEPSAKTTIGPIPDRPVEDRIAERVTVTPEGLSRGKELAAAEGLKAAQEAQRLRQQLEAAEASMRAAAEREARFDEAIAAVAQKDAAERAREAAEATLATREEELAAVRGTLAGVEADLATTKASLADAESTLDQAEGALKAAGEHALQQAGKIAELTEANGRLMADLKTAQEEAAEHAAEAASLREQLAEANRLLREEKSLHERVQVELAEERRTFPERARAWAEEHVAGPLRSQLAEVEAALKTAKTEITGFPARITAAEQAVEDRMNRAMEAMEQRLQASFDRMAAGIEARLQKVIDARDATIAGLQEQLQAARDAAAAPLQRVADAVRGGQQRPAGAPRLLSEPGPGDDFYTARPQDWTPEQRAYAERELEARKEADPRARRLTVEQFGEQANRAWERTRPQQGGPGGSEPGPTGGGSTGPR